MGTSTWEMGAKKDPKKDSKTPAKNPKKKEGGGGGKAKKKKWSKGKSRDKLNNLVLFDKNTYDKLYKEVPTYKLITPSIVSERLKVRGSLAKRALEEMEGKGLIKKVSADLHQDHQGQRRGRGHCRGRDQGQGQAEGK